MVFAAESVWRPSAAHLLMFDPATGWDCSATADADDLTGTGVGPVGTGTGRANRQAGSTVSPCGRWFIDSQPSSVTTTMSSIRAPHSPGK